MRTDVHSISSTNVSIENGFWADRQATNRDRTIPAITHQMDITGRLDAWRLDWHEGEPKPHIFWDSDAGKWIEAISYSLKTHPNAAFEQKVDEVADLIEKAQQPDGYLNIFYTAVEPHNKWKNLREKHELYDAGHLIEGAVAYHQATGKRKLLDVLTRYANHIDSMFGREDGKKRGYPGHPELELALVKLYHETGEQRYLNLSKYFVDERGQEPHYFDVEARERGEDPRAYWAKDYRYCQAHIPVRQQHTAVGHSVRANYLYSGMADVALETQDESLLDATRMIWDDLTQHQMYITGGLGPAHTNEGFTFNYDLPNETAYAETCASIALAFWAQRMFKIDPDSKYIDVMERALYNGILSGVAYDGGTFFYANPLSSYPNVNPFERWSGITSKQYYRRSEWFYVACCPPPLPRTVAHVGEYSSPTTPDTLYVHLYDTNTVRTELSGKAVTLQTQTNYPWDSEINIGVQVVEPTQFDIALRIPGWCRNFTITVNGAVVDVIPREGYAHLKRIWANGDEIRLSLVMPVERMKANPMVRQDVGSVALQRGPVVYCLEGVDNGTQLAQIALPSDSKLTASVDSALFGGVGVIAGDAVRVDAGEWRGGLYQPESAIPPSSSPAALKAIPYFLWANREPGEMQVWLREK